jgi:DNA-binding transcriptional LysR family regulator
MTPWTGIDEFVAVAQARSFTVGAKRLGRSASQVSRDIASLEDRLGARLFYRTTRHVSLTEAGERFLDRCRRLVEERDEAILSAAAETGELQGHLRMTCAVAYGERFIVPLINSFMLDHPRVSVDIDLTNQVLDMIGGGYDLAVRFGQMRDSGLIATRLTHRTRPLTASPAYLERAGTPTSLDELSRHASVVGPQDTWAFTRNGKAFTYRPVGRWRGNSGYAVLDAALQGLGLCQLPNFYVEQHLRSGALVGLLEQHQPPDEGVWAVYPHRRHLPPKVRAMMEHLQAHFGRLSRPSGEAAPPPR